MKRYVVGFGVTETDQVWLVRKNRSGVPVGWNGIGGKVEEQDYSPATAMAREWREETGTLWPHDAREVCTLIGDGFQVDFFVARVPYYALPQANDAGEEMLLFSALPLNVVPNLRWLLPMAFEALRQPGRGAPYTVFESANLAQAGRAVA